MKKSLSAAAILLICMNFAGCSTQHDPKPMPMNQSSGYMNNNTASMTNSNQPVGGTIAQAMDSNDREKMFRALDKSIGKPTQWVNQRTQIKFTVVPTAKVAVQGNQFCRKYMVTAIGHQNKQQTNGLACVSQTNSAWQEIE